MRPSCHANRRGRQARDEKDPWSVCQALANRRRGRRDPHRATSGRGYARTRIKRWVRRGLLVRLYQGVYAVGHLALNAGGQVAGRAAGLRRPTPFSATLGAGVPLGSPGPRPCDDRRDGRGRTAPTQNKGFVCTECPRSTTATSECGTAFGSPRPRAPSSTSPRRSPLTSWTGSSPRPARRASFARGELEAALERGGRRRGGGRNARLPGDRGRAGLHPFGGRAEASPPPASRRVFPSRGPTDARAGHEVDFLWWRRRSSWVEFDGYKFHGHSTRL